MVTSAEFLGEISDGVTHFETSEREQKKKRFCPRLQHEISRCGRSCPFCSVCESHSHPLLAQFLAYVFVGVALWREKLFIAYLHGSGRAAARRASRIAHLAILLPFSSDVLATTEDRAPKCSKAGNCDTLVYGERARLTPSRLAHARKECLATKLGLSLALVAVFSAMQGAMRLVVARRGMPYGNHFDLSSS